MTSAWDDLASSPRWHGVVSFIRNWVGPFSAKHGMAGDELDEILRAKSLTLPKAVQEWYLLAANWSQGGINVWIHPRELVEFGGAIMIFSTTEGSSAWYLRVADCRIDDPPVASLDNKNQADFEFPHFSTFVSAMIVNDVIFDYTTEAPVELIPDSISSKLMHLVSSSCGDVFADAPLESATIVIYAYSNNGPICAKARTSAGRAWLQQLKQ